MVNYGALRMKKLTYDKVRDKLRNHLKCLNKEIEFRDDCLLMSLVDAINENIEEENILLKNHDKMVALIKSGQIKDRSPYDNCKTENEMNFGTKDYIK